MNMQSHFDKNALWGAILIGFGLLFLVNNFFNVGSFASAIVGLLFLGGAAVSGMVFLSDRNRWWAVFPAFMLGFIGLNILNNTIPFLWLINSGTLFLLGFGLAFLLVFLRNQTQVWPIIPAGFWLTLATITMTPNFINDGLIFFGGLSATFAATYVLSLRTGERWGWALIPAAGCAFIASLIVAGIVFKYLFPIALVGLGVYLIYRNTQQQA